MMDVRVAASDEDIARCFPVMRELRPELVEGEFVARVRRQSESGYALAYVEERDEVRSVAGFRFLENLALGRFLYGDDLVTASGERSRGHGGVLFRWLVELARRRDCAAVELDSGVQRFGAHRFYLSNRMVISSHHFHLRLEGEQGT